MKRIIIIFSALFITVLSGVGYINYKNITYNNKDNSKEVIEEEKKSISEEAKKEDSEKGDSQSSNEMKEEQLEKNASQPNKEVKKEQSDKIVKEDEKSTKAVQNNISSQTTKKAETKPKKENSVSKKQEAAIGVVDPDGNNKTIDTVKSVDSEPWVKAGVSKDDYYNKPVYPWARIDYPVSQCKSLAECESLCMKDAEPLAYTEDVSCVQIYTYSGTYLGEMLKRK